MENESTAAQLDRDEYASLRRAIAGRGQLRTTLFVAGLASWALVLVAILVTLPYPLVSIVPLTLLLGVFEAIRPLHTGAERIGRYLQVFYEERGEPGRPLAETPSWERTARAVCAAFSSEASRRRCWGSRRSPSWSRIERDGAIRTVPRRQAAAPGANALHAGTSPAECGTNASGPGPSGSSHELRCRTDAELEEGPDALPTRLIAPRSGLSGP